MNDDSSVHNLSASEHQAQPESGRDSHPGESTGRFRRVSARNQRKVLRLQIGLFVSLVALAVVIIAGTVTMQRAADEQAQLVFELRKAERDLSAATKQLGELRGQLDELVAKRIPGLRPLRYDETITIAEGYVRNISFTLAKSNDEYTYEFRIVLSNDGVVSVLPNVNILLFDERGIQLGQADITVTEFVAEQGETSLEAGEVRSFSDSIALSHGTEPKYFVVRID